MLPLSFAQERLWLLDQIDGASAAYNIPCAVHLAGALDTAALERAVNEVVRRHEALRTRFEAVSGEPRQVIEPPLPVPLPVVDLAGASEAEALRLAASEAARPFDLTRSPLLRACLLRRSAEDHLLVLTLHHIAADGWSLGDSGARARGLLSGGDPGGAPHPVRRLRPLAAELALRRDAGAGGRLVAGAARRSAGGDPPAHRPAADGGTLQPGGALPDRPAAAGGAWTPSAASSRRPSSWSSWRLSRPSSPGGAARRTWWWAPPSPTATGSRPKG